MIIDIHKYLGFLLMEKKNKKKLFKIWKKKKENFLFVIS